MIKIIISALALMLVVMNASCQKKVTAWKIVCEIKDLDSIGYQAMDSNMATREVTWIKDNKQRSETSTKKDAKAMIQLYDDKNDETSSLFIKDKVALVTNHKMPDFLNVKPSKHIFKYTDESKIICGYKCYKAIMTLEGRNDSDTIYYNKDIKDLNGKNSNGHYSGLDGYLMECYNTDNHKHRVKYQVTEIRKEDVDESIFEIPKDYEVKNFQFK